MLMSQVTWSDLFQGLFDLARLLEQVGYIP